ERVEDDALVKRMNDATHHRGPDATGIWRDDFATLGNNRLAIIDLSPGANQPMKSVSGRYVIVFNGEIYNFRELRAQLTSYQFSTHSDTEVILAGFEKWGTDVFAKLRGMFGLAIWDNEKHELTLARDQSGIKPLYYRRDGKRIAFSSELKGILADKTIARKINHEALESYLRLRYVPEPFTFVCGVAKLPAGSYATVCGENFSITPYFEVPLMPLIRGSRRAVEGQIENLIDAAVKAELVSDRPVGLFLSGGLDSTIVLDSATRAMGKVETFSLRFEVSADEQPEKFNADADLAAQTAAHYGANHHEILLSEEKFIALLPEALYSLDQPIANATAVAQFYLAHEARKHIVVALAGDGGDELFGGYPRYRLSRFMDWYQRSPQWARTLLGFVSSQFLKLNTPAGTLRIQRFLFEKDNTLSRVVAPELLSQSPAHRFEERYLSGRGEADFTQLFMDADRRSWLVDEDLARTDTTTMSASLEARVPLLNTDLVLYASRIPSNQRVSLRGASKGLLRDAFKKRLPAHVLLAPKSGFFSPTAKWLRRPAMLALVREVLAPGYHPPTDALLNFEGITTMLDAHVAKREYAMTTLWTLVTLRLWAKQYDATL
ncbi:MAG: asparagine synthase (glutamine-hydrolyzing), partial [bacterium]|nr:asparagine synthase (glutamine-hydrolyzing) [bacterium]